MSPTYILVLVPFLLGRWNNKFKNVFGYGISILLLNASALFFIPNKIRPVSNRIDFAPEIAVFFFVQAIIFAIIYIISSWFKKRGTKIIPSLVMLIGILFVLSQITILIMNTFHGLKF